MTRNVWSREGIRYTGLIVGFRGKVRKGLTGFVSAAREDVGWHRICLGKATSCTVDKILN